MKVRHMELRTQIHSIPRNPSIIKFFCYAKLGELLVGGTS